MSRESAFSVTAFTRPALESVRNSEKATVFGSAVCMNRYPADAMVATTMSTPTPIQNSRVCGNLPPSTEHSYDAERDRPSCLVYPAPAGRFRWNGPFFVEDRARATAGCTVGLSAPDDSIGRVLACK